MMGNLLKIPSEKMAVVPLGINLSGYSRRKVPRDGSTYRVGYFARLAPEKGLHVLADAYIRLRRRTGAVPMALDAAGYLAPAQQGYLDEVRRMFDSAGLGAEFTYRGAVDRDAKLAFLQTLDVFSVPAPYDEPKGVFLLEAMASGVPVVQPRRGAFTEIVEHTGGGVLVPPDDPAALADGLYSLWADRGLAAALGERGYEGVRRHYRIARSTDRLLAVYDSLAGGAAHSPAEDRRLASRH